MTIAWIVVKEEARDETDSSGPGAHEEVWSLGDQSILPNSPDMGDQDQYHSHEYLPEEEQPPGMIQKSDTINSTTIFINPNDVHSPQQQQEEMPGGSGRQGQTSEQGVKRRYSECGEGDGSAGEVKVVVVRPGQQEDQQHVYHHQQHHQPGVSICSENLIFSCPPFWPN